MKRVIVASKNPVKIACSKEGFLKMFPKSTFAFEGVSVSSNVSDQPMSCEETMKGAVNRAEAAFVLERDADMWVGIEAGIEKKGGEMYAFAWVVVKTFEGVYKAKSGMFSLPPKIQELIEQGVELGDADDQVFGVSNSKQKNGAVGLLTGDVVTRGSLYEQAVCLALAPVKSAQYFTMLSKSAG